MSSGIPLLSEPPDLLFKLLHIAARLFLRSGQLRKICLDRDQGMVNKRRSREELKEVDALVERLREFTRLNYVTAGRDRSQRFDRVFMASGSSHTSGTQAHHLKESLSR